MKMHIIYSHGFWTDNRHNLLMLLIYNWPINQHGRSYESLCNYKRNQNVTFFAFNFIKEQRTSFSTELWQEELCWGRELESWKTKKEKHQQKAFLTVWNTLIMIPVLFDIEMKPKLMIQEGNRSVYAAVTHAEE